MTDSTNAAMTPLQICLLVLAGVYALSCMIILPKSTSHGISQPSRLAFVAIVLAQMATRTASLYTAAFIYNQAVAGNEGQGFNTRVSSPLPDGLPYVSAASSTGHEHWVGFVTLDWGSLLYLLCIVTMVVTNVRAALASKILRTYGVIGHVFGPLSGGILGTAGPAVAASFSGAVASGAADARMSAAHRQSKSMSVPPGSALAQPLLGRDALPEDPGVGSVLPKRIKSRHLSARRMHKSVNRAWYGSALMVIVTYLALTLSVYVAGVQSVGPLLLVPVFFAACSLLGAVALVVAAFLYVRSGVLWLAAPESPDQRAELRIQRRQTLSEPERVEASIAAAAEAAALGAERRAQQAPRIVRRSLSNASEAFVHQYLYVGVASACTRCSQPRLPGQLVLPWRPRWMPLCHRSLRLPAAALLLGCYSLLRACSNFAAAAGVHTLGADDTMYSALLYFGTEVVILVACCFLVLSSVQNDGWFDPGDPEYVLTLFRLVRHKSPLLARLDTLFTDKRGPGLLAGASSSERALFGAGAIREVAQPQGQDEADATTAGPRQERGRSSRADSAASHSGDARPVSATTSQSSARSYQHDMASPPRASSPPVASSNNSSLTPHIQLASRGFRASASTVQHSSSASHADAATGPQPASAAPSPSEVRASPRSARYSSGSPSAAARALRHRGTVTHTHSPRSSDVWLGHDVRDEDDDEAELNEGDGVDLPAQISILHTLLREVATSVSSIGQRQQAFHSATMNMVAAHGNLLQDRIDDTMRAVYDSNAEVMSGMARVPHAGLPPSSYVPPALPHASTAAAIEGGASGRHMPHMALQAHASRGSLQ